LDGETGRLARLGRALLMLSRVQRGDEDAAIAIVPLQPLLEDVLAEQTARSGVSVELACPADLAAVTNGDLVAEALSNLISNAYTYTAAGRVPLAGARVVTWARGCWSSTTRRRFATPSATHCEATATTSPGARRGRKRSRPSAPSPGTCSCSTSCCRGSPASRSAAGSAP